LEGLHNETTALSFIQLTSCSTKSLMVQTSARIKKYYETEC